MGKILFRAHGAGALMTNKQGAGITEIQLATLKKYEDQVVEGLKPLTATQLADMQKLKAKRDAPFELSDTAKKYVRDLWLLNEKGIRYEVTSKYLEKGLWGEADARALLSKVLGRLLVQNAERKSNGAFSGFADIIEPKLNCGHDIKCSWNAETFMNAELSPLYEWQARIYMELYNVDKFYVHFCLVDCPSHIYEYELYKFKNKYNIIDETTPENFEKIENFRRGLIYTGNPTFTEKERVKTFEIERDDKMMTEMYDRAIAAVEYYKSLSLNGVR